MEKVESKHSASPRATPIWQGDEEMILKFSGLK
jgi:hypothetical protein